MVVKRETLELPETLEVMGRLARREARVVKVLPVPRGQSALPGLAETREARVRRVVKEARAPRGDRVIAEKMVPKENRGFRGKLDQRVATEQMVQRVKRANPETRG